MIIHTTEVYEKKKTRPRSTLMQIVALLINYAINKGVSNTENLLNF